MLMALFQNKESLSSNKTTRVCGQADKNVQLQARPRGLIGVRRKFNLLLHPIVIRRLTLYCLPSKIYHCRLVVYSVANLVVGSIFLKPLYLLYFKGLYIVLTTKATEYLRKSKFRKSNYK